MQALVHPGRGSGAESHQEYEPRGRAWYSGWISVSDPRQACARLLLVGFPGREVDRDVGGLIDAGVLGTILFARNIGTAAETALLVRALKSRAGRPFAVSVDQEGGRVARLRGHPYTALPPMRAIGQSGDGGLARQVGRLLAFELRATGLRLGLRPGARRGQQPGEPGHRRPELRRGASQGGEAGRRARRGAGARRGRLCGKHFPGHGDTLQDSHLTLPVLQHGLARMEAVELVPFAAYARAGLASVMTAHVRFPALGRGRRGDAQPRP